MLAKSLAVVLSSLICATSAKNISALEVTSAPIHETAEVHENAENDAEPEVFDRFGPQSCVMLSRTEHRTCMIATRCADLDLDDVDFKFVCFNPGTTVPHALHSFGRGGFDGEEDFDSGVVCDKCTSVGFAMQQGGPLVRSALRALPQKFLLDAASNDGLLHSAEQNIAAEVGSHPPVISSSGPTLSIPNDAAHSIVGTEPLHTLEPSEVSVEDTLRTPETVSHLVPVAHAGVPQPVTVVRQPQPVQVVHEVEPVVRTVPVVHPVAQPVTVPVQTTIHNPMSLPVDVHHDARAAPPTIEGLSPRVQVDPVPQVQTVPATHSVSQSSPGQAAYFGPSSCIITFRSPSGSCIIQTRCEEHQLAGFNVGVTCLDSGGGYARYLFGKDSFHSQETFDTRIQCQQCLGVGADRTAAQMHGTLPKGIVDNVNSLKKEVQMLRDEVKNLVGAQSDSAHHGDSQGEHNSHGGEGGHSGGSSSSHGNGHGGSSDIRHTFNTERHDEEYEEEDLDALAPAPSFASAPSATLHTPPVHAAAALLHGGDEDEEFASRVFDGAPEENEFAHGSGRRAPVVIRDHQAHHTVRNLKDLLNLAQ